MNKSTYNTESIRQYLLGTLSDAETEQFDGLSFTDDEFVDAVKVEERDLIDAYVQGELRDPVSSQFEARYFASSLKREKVELARAFYDYHDWIAADAVSNGPANVLNGIKNLFPLARWRWQWGLVGLASLILAFVAWSVFISPNRKGPEQSLSSSNSSAPQQNTVSEKTNEPSHAATPDVAEKLQEEAKQSVVENQRPQRSASRMSSAVSVILSPQMRGTTEIPLVSVPVKADHVKLNLELEPNDYSVYRVVLLDQTAGDVLWRSPKVSGQIKDGRQKLHLHLPLQRLKAGPYVLQVYGLTESGKTEQISDYHFRLMR
jgi:hypothetical protein